MYRGHLDRNVGRPCERHPVRDAGERHGETEAIRGLGACPRRAVAAVLRSSDANARAVGGRATMEMSDAVENVGELPSAEIPMVAFRERHASPTAATISREEDGIACGGHHLHRIQGVRDPTVEA